MKNDTHRLTGWTAAVVTTAAFGKTFLPFYLIGSTPIFAAASTVGVALAALNWRSMRDMASKAPDIVLVLAAFYSLVAISFFVHSHSAVPMTHLVGILVFHMLFLVFGLSAARALNIVLMGLLGAAAVYLLVIIHYAVRFGDLMKDGYLQDIFNVQRSSVFVTFHQNIGIVLGLAALAALGLSSNRISRAFAIAALPLMLLFMFYIAARGSLVALVCSLVFLVGAGAWVRSRKLTLLAAVAIIMAVALASGLFYQRALQSKDIDPTAPDAISRTIREIQDPRPGFRMQIWARAWHRISAEPDRLLFGRGIGMYPVDEGVGAPDWLLRKTEASRHYPHNVYLEMLYETGIAGLVLFGLLTLLPLAFALRRWHLLSLVQKSAISMYVFQLVNAQFSGGFAFGYLDQFFLGLAVGVIALSRANDASVRDQYATRGAE